MARRYEQGNYNIKNPEKYVGDIHKIMYRSSWELNVFGFLDNNPNILNWASEEIGIQYFDKVSKKVRTYYPDLWIKYKSKDGTIKQELVEIKPKSQTKMPKKNHKYYLTEQLTFITNKCKWAAAIKWCEQHNIKFRILTETAIYK